MKKKLFTAIVLCLLCVFVIGVTAFADDEIANQSLPVEEVTEEIVEEAQEETVTEDLTAEPVEHLSKEEAEEVAEEPAQEAVESTEITAESTEKSVEEATEDTAETETTIVETVEEPADATQEIFEETSEEPKENVGQSYIVTISDLNGNSINVDGGSQTVISDVLKGLGYEIGDDTTIEIDFESVDPTINVTADENGNFVLADNGPFKKAEKNLVVYINGEAVELELVDPNAISGSMTAEDIQTAFGTEDNPSDVILTGDVTLTGLDKAIELSIGSHSLYLNSFKLSKTEGTSALFTIGDGVTLEVYSGDVNDDGTGSIDSVSTIFNVLTGGTLYIYKGTYESSVESNGVVQTDGTFVANDATFTATGSKSTAVLAGGNVELYNCTGTAVGKGITSKQSATLNIDGGSYTGFSGIQAEGTVNLKNATFSSNQNTDEYDNAVYVVGMTNLTIFSGTFNGAVLLEYDNSAKVIIHDGEFKKIKTTSIDVKNTNSSSGFMLVLGGSFDGDLEKGDTGRLYIAGGKYASDPTNYLVSNFEVKNISENPYLYEVVVPSTATDGINAVILNSDGTSSGYDKISKGLKTDTYYVFMINNVSDNLDVSGNFSLNLNGNVLSPADPTKPIITVESSKSLSLIDTNPYIVHHFTGSTDAITAGLWAWDKTETSTEYTVCGGVITGAKNGAIVNNGTILNNVNIAGNTGEHAIVNNYKLTLIKGNICGNYGTENGGAIYNAGNSNTKLTIWDAYISWNISEKSGGGIFSLGNVTLDGENIFIAGNTSDGKQSNLYLGTNAGTDAKITATKYLKNGIIGVSTEKEPGATEGVQFTDNSYTCSGLGTNFFSDNNDYCIYESAGKAYLSVQKTSVLMDGCYYDSVSDAVRAAANGSFILLEGNCQDDVVIDNKLIYIDLNGNVLYAKTATSVIEIKNGGELMLSDSNPDAEHHFSELSGGLWNWDPTETATDHIVLGGVVTGGVSTNGGGIYNDGTFIMYGGNICGNSATGTGTNEACGGGVYMTSNDSIATISGGSIRGNTADKYGAGLFANGTLTIDGGLISDNVSGVFGGGVYAQAENLFAVGGDATIDKNSLSDGTVSNLCLMKLQSGTQQTLQINQDFAGSVGVSADTLPEKGTQVQISTGDNASGFGKYFHSDNANLYVIVKNNNLCLSADEPAAEIDGDNYLTVQEAADAASSEETKISILRAVSENISINATRNIVIDLNGKTFTSNITVYGNLTLEGSKTESILDGDIVADSGKVVINSGYYKGSLSVKNNGSISVSGGFFTNDPTPFVDATKYTVIDRGTAEEYRYTLGHITHDWRYSAAGDTISAVCKATAACEEGTEAKTIKVSAEDIEYNAKPYDKLIISGNTLSDAFKNITVEFAGRDGTQYVKTETSPVNEGKYTAYITCGGVTASANFEIKPAKVDPKPNPEPEKPAEVVAPIAVFVQKIDLTSLTEIQTNAVEQILKANNLTLVVVIDVYTKAGDTKITSGAAVFGIDSSIFAGYNPSTLRAWKLNADNTLTEVPFEVIDGKIVFNNGELGVYILTA